MVTIVDPPPSGTGAVCYTRIPFPIPSGLLQRPIITAYAGEADLTPYDVTYKVTGSDDQGEPTCCGGVDSIAWPSSGRVGALYPVEAGDYEFTATVDTGVDGRVALSPALLTVVGAECLQIECAPCGLDDCPPCEEDPGWRVVFVTHDGSDLIVGSDQETARVNKFCYGGEVNGVLILGEYASAQFNLAVVNDKGEFAVEADWSWTSNATERHPAFGEFYSMAGYNLVYWPYPREDVCSSDEGAVAIIDIIGSGENLVYSISAKVGGFDAIPAELKIFPND